ncbi:nucleotidyltransferase family protein [Pelagibacteraceae bacterium]|jgi:N-acetyl-alpha-D-muramate 1-phosphate uridylyltransferase|nr:nucleotidyltransferase family protein [Pelagibacteraceae bacterium]
MLIKKAIILAAGFGKRLLPLTKELPKPLLEIGGKKLIEYSIDLLRENNITEIIINSHYLHEKISEFITKKYPNISLSYEKNILDTGGGILNAMSFFDQENFFVLNSDTVWTRNYSDDLHKLKEVFKNGNSKAALLLAHKKDSFDKNLSGDFSLDQNNLLNKSSNDYIYTGCQLLNPNIFNLKKRGDIFSMNEIWNDLIAQESLNGCLSSCSFLHATNLEIYNQLIRIETID